MKNDVEQLPLQEHTGEPMSRSIEDARKCVEAAVKHIARATAGAAARNVDPRAVLALANATTTACNLLEQINALNEEGQAKGALDTHWQFMSSAANPAAPEPMDPDVIAQLQRARRFDEAAGDTYCEKSEPRR